jgi:hypothetical protein
MQEKNKDSTPGKNGSWTSFIFASLCTLPFTVFSLMHLIATSFNMPMLLASLRFYAVIFPLFFAIAALLGLISIGFAIKQQPQMLPILMLYAIIIIGDVLSWVYAISNLGSL